MSKKISQGTTELFRKYRKQKTPFKIEEGRISETSI